MLNDLTIVIPATESDINLVNLALDSIEQNTVKPKEVIIVLAGDQELITNLHSFNIRVINNTEDTSIQGQLNLGFGKAETKYVAYLESDDQVSERYVGIVEKYLTADLADLYLTINLNINSETNEYIGFGNEISWANGFTEKIGFLDLETIKHYNLFQLSGMVVSKSLFTRIGGFKPSMKHSFDYEFLLRAAFKGLKIMVIPKIGNKHFVGRKDSFTVNMSKVMTSKEYEFWNDLALTEYIHTTDRQIAYEQES